MSVPVPRFAKPSSVLALVALACLMSAAATATAARAQAPDPAPLWKAYPLSPGRTTGANPPERPNGAPLIVDETPPSRTNETLDAPAQMSVPLGVAIAFYLALAVLSALGVGAATLYVVRRRAQPVTCEISWAPAEQGAAFLATAQRNGQEKWVVARSGRFDRGTTEPPEYDAASHAAYDQLLSELYADGWLPYERGREWWEMRLRRTTAPEPRAPARHG
jgi:hypothetical protein